MSEEKKPVRRRRRRRKGSGKKYFTEVHEKAILDYVATRDVKERTYLYTRFIGPAFDEMVDKIVFTYKFTTLPNIDSLRDECKIWLITILDKYDVNRGSKAFSYFSVITKNWFIHKVKKQNKKTRTEILRDSKKVVRRHPYGCLQTKKRTVPLLLFKTKIEPSSHQKRNNSSLRGSLGPLLFSLK